MTNSSFVAVTFTLRRLVGMTALALVVTGCTNIPPGFHTMSEEELYTYNLSQPVLNRVMCRVERTTSSFIRKRRCYTVRELVDANSNSVLALDVLNYGAHYNAGIGRRGD